MNCRNNNRILNPKMTLLMKKEMISKVEQKDCKVKPRYTYEFKVAPILQQINVRERKCKVTFSIISDHRRLPLIFPFINKRYQMTSHNKKMIKREHPPIIFYLNCCSKRTNVVFVIEYIGHIGDDLPLCFNFVVDSILCI